MGDVIEAQARWRKRGIGQQGRLAGLARDPSEEDLAQEDLDQTIGLSQEQIQILALLKVVRRGRRPSPGPMTTVFSVTGTARGPGSRICAALRAG